MKVLLLTLALGLSPVSSLLVLGQGATAPAASSSSTREDDRIEDLVRIRLAGNRDTGGAGSIKVAVKGGVVTLTGKVESERVKSAAEKQAKKVKGVKSVANQLVIAPKM
jgi:osmotically-inducible protein OsmY